MAGLKTPQPIDRGIEAALRNERKVAIAGLVAMVLLAWFYLWRAAAGMDTVSAVTAAAPHAMDPVALVVTFVMWVVMMVAMMLPSAAPAILTYGTIVRSNRESGTALPGLWIFTGGYLLAWAAFSLVATLLQAMLERAALLTPAMTSASATLSALALVLAGAWQLTPLKRACLVGCRNPLEFLLTRWRPGPRGAFRIGLAHGMACVGCCWALMLLLFVAGVMNLLWVALIAAFVLVEKLLPAGTLVARGSGAALLLAGLYLLVKVWPGY